MGNFRLITAQNNLTTVANTDIISDYDVPNNGVIRIGLETTTAADVRITLDGTNYTTLTDSAAEIWEFFEIPVSGDDTFNIQTVAIEIISLRVLYSDA